MDVKDRGLPLAAGGLTALAGAGLIDLMMGATPFAWMVENFRMNITENRAADFGVSGPLAYFGQMLSYWQLAAIPLLMLARSVKQIGRASCRERGCQYVSISEVAVSLQKKQ